MELHHRAKAALIAAVIAQQTLSFDDHLSVHMRVQAADIVVGARRIELAGKALVGIQRMRLHLQIGADDTVRDVVVIDPCYRCAGFHLQRCRRKGEVVDDNLSRCGVRHFAKDCNQRAGAMRLRTVPGVNSSGLTSRSSMLRVLTAGSGTGEVCLPNSAI